MGYNLLSLFHAQVTSAQIWSVGAPSSQLLGPACHHLSDISSSLPPLLLFLLRSHCVAAVDPELCVGQDQTGLELTETYLPGFCVLG